MRKHQWLGLLTPLAILLLASLLQLAGKLRWITPPGPLFDTFVQHLGSGSLILIAICSFFEGLAVVNIYFPGSVVILYSMAATHGNLPRALSVFAAIVIGSMVAHQLNYLAGRVLTRAQRLASGTESPAPTLGGAFASYWHPHLGSLYSVRSGSDNVPYFRFIVRFSVTFGTWNLFWGILMYHLGRIPISGSEFLLIFYLYLGWWTFQEVRAIRAHYRSEQSTERDPQS